MINKTMLSLREASEITGLPYGFLRKLCLDNQIKHVRSGVKFYVNMNSLNEFCGGIDEPVNGRAKITSLQDFAVNKIMEG